MIIQKLRKIGDQYLVGVPKIFIKDFGWKRGDWIAIELLKKGEIKIFKVEIEEIKKKGRANNPGDIGVSKK